MLDILAQGRKDPKAARRFFRKLLRGQGELPSESTADKMGSCVAAKRDALALEPHFRERYANNRAAVSHEHARGREWQWRGYCCDGPRSALCPCTAWPVAVTERLNTQI